MDDSIRLCSSRDHPTMAMGDARSSIEKVDDENCGSLYSHGKYVGVEVEKEMRPILGMTFSSDEDARKFYNCHAMQKGFQTKVKSSWCHKKTKEKNVVLFACSREGFKVEKKSALYRKANLRVGCNAHLKIRLTDSKEWKVVGLNLDHNHACNTTSLCRPRSHKNSESGGKRRLELHADAGLRSNKSFHGIAVDAGADKGEQVKAPFGEKEPRNYVDKCKRLNLSEGDARAMHKYLTSMQQKSPSFFYSVDFDDEGHLRNAFWADGNSRAAYGYFGDVISFNTTYLTNQYDLKFASFVGVNNHGQYVLFGCGLLADETAETFVWVFRAWLTAVSGCPPSVMITDQCKAVEKATLEVLPRACHHLCLWDIMNKISKQLGGLSEYEAVKKAMENAVFDSMRINKFEEAWANMIQQYQLQGNAWLTTLYNLRQQWVPVFLKDIFFAGMSTGQHFESVNAFFDGYVHSKTSLKEFFEDYESFFKDKYDKESKMDFESSHSDLCLKTSCFFERQIAKVYTKAMFLKCQEEVYGMGLCSKSQLKVDGQISAYSIRERILDKNGNLQEPKVYEVLFNKAETRVFCICRLFQHEGILCKHALCVLNEYVDEIPSQYIIPRWRKDFKCKHVENRGFAYVNFDKPAERYAVLYPYALQILEEGVFSESNFKIVLDGLKNLKKKVLNGNNGSCDYDKRVV